MSYKTMFVCCILFATAASAQDHPGRQPAPKNGYQESTARTETGVRQMREAFMTHSVDYKASTASIRYGVDPYADDVADSIGSYDGRYPFGQGTWARLETNVPLSIGGKTVKPGLYCLALERSEGDWALVLFPDEQIRYRNLPASQVPPVGELGESHPLLHERIEAAGRPFTVEFEEDGYEAGKGTLRIRFGTRQWSAAVAMDLARAGGNR